MSELGTFERDHSEQGHCYKGFSEFCVCKHIEIFALNCFAFSLWRWMSLNSLFDGAEPPKLQVDPGDFYKGPTPLKVWFEAFKYSTYPQTKVRWYL